MNYYFLALKRYAKFSGRSQRAEYWWFYSINTIVLCTLGFLSYKIGDVGFIIAVSFGLFILVPSFAVLVRRLHDVGESGMMMFTSVIPLWLLNLTVKDGDPGENKYGPNPKNLN
jgi:uncharacterized membrane protein YhaH (DUF805 family)